MNQRQRPAEYPLLPLKNVVVFPKTIVTLIVGRERSIWAVEEAMERDNTIVVATQRQADLEDPTPADIYTVGTLAEIMQMHKQPDGNVQVVVEGIRRVVIQKYPQTKSFFKVQVTDLVEQAEVGQATQILMRHVLEAFERYAKLNRNVPQDAVESLTRMDDAGRLADIMTAHLPIDIATKQSILETASHRDRLDRISIILNNEIEILEVEQKIRARVRAQMDRNQREYYLKEQLKAIHEELGTDAMSEAQELRTKLQAKGMPEPILARMLKEVDRLERMPQTSPENHVLRTYLDLVLALPWSERTEDRLDINLAEDVLNEDHYGLEKVKERIIEFLAVRQLVAQTQETPHMRGPILCFIGPPGVGKTSLGKSIARAMNRKFIRLSLGGVRDEAEIRGHRRTYVGAMPGRIIQAMRSVGTKNPVIMLDEIDKMSADFRGDPSAALLEVLDPEQNNAFVDHYLDAPFDLSEVMFIATANARWNIPRPLLDRMEVIEIHGYTEDEKVQIARRYLVPKQLREHGLQPQQVEFTERALRKIVQQYTHEAGVRNLERAIATVCRKAARRVIKEPEKHVKVSPSNLEVYLGPPKYHHQGALEESQVGVAMGLAWTEHGGELLPVEVVTMPGKGGMLLTGRLGEVMQESARAALSYARARADILKIDRSFQERVDLHIHLPEGAIPKDGPSAGVTMCAALVSALTRRPIRNDVAMTGEITLRGKVLAIGGVKEKVLAAHRAGLRKVILPKENQRDLPEIPRNIRNQMEFIWVQTMDDVLRAALVEAPAGLTAAISAGEHTSTTPMEPSPPTSEPPETSIDPVPAADQSSEHSDAHTQQG